MSEKYKVGDKVRIIKELYGHQFLMDEIVTIVSDSYGSLKANNGKSTWIIRVDEIELVEECPVEKSFKERFSDEVICAYCNTTCEGACDAFGPQEILVPKDIDREKLTGAMSHIEYKDGPLEPLKIIGEQVSATGSVRKNVGKPQTHHIDPEFMLGMAKVLTFGASKYSPRNWMKGNDITVPYDSCMRHLLAFMGGEDDDPETGENHLFSAGVNLMFMYFYYKNFPEMDDRCFGDKYEKD